MDRTHEPALRSGAASAAITSLSFNVAPPPSAPALAALQQQAAAGGGAVAGAGALGPPGGGAAAAHQLLALGDAAGVLHLMALPRTLRRPLPGEAKLMAEFVRREAARVSEVAARQVRVALGRIIKGAGPPGCACAQV